MEPSETDLEIYVGLEHLDSESLKINRHGKPEDVKGTKLRVHTGDIIFGKRRAYQRKLAIADFEGICSAHAMVLRAKEENMAKDFFPFFLQSDIFMERALDISVGSLSPTINWKTLKVQEFPLPPLDEQHRMADLLWTLEDAIRKKDEFAAAAKRYKKALMKHLFTYGPVAPGEIPNIDVKKVEIWTVPKEWKVEKIDKLIEETSQINPLEKPGKIIKYVDIASVSGDLHRINEYQEILGKDAPSRARKLIKQNDIIFATVRPYQKKVAQVPDYLENEICSTGFCVLRPKKDIIDPTFLFYSILSDRFIRHICAYQTGTNYPAVTDKAMKNLKIPRPPLPEQQKIAEILSKLDRNIEGFEAHKLRLQNLKKRLLNDLLTGKMRLGGV